MENIKACLVECLPWIDARRPPHSILSSPVNCPSITDSFTSDGTSCTDQDDRSYSFPSAYASPGPPLYVPTYTALPVVSLVNTDPPLKLEISEDEKNYLYFTKVLDHGQQYVSHGGDNWFDNTYGMQIASSENLLDNNQPFSTSDPYACSAHPALTLRYPYNVHHFNNPSLSRPISFHKNSSQLLHPVGDEMIGAWSSPMTATISSPVSTIAPSAMIQSMMVSSPVVQTEPLTPVKREIYSHSFMDSTPYLDVSPPIVPSQHNIDDLLDSPTEKHLLSMELKKQNSRADRLHRRGHERRRRRSGSPTKTQPGSSKSPIKYELIIRNTFKCSYEGCEKLFKRSEHKKRHEKTVHEKDISGIHRCWVSGCKTDPFTRTDNLKSHLRNTHGKRSANRRNRYVATQDPESAYYDPDWRGDLDSEGYPIL